jgi:MFS family permease
VVLDGRNILSRKRLCLIDSRGLRLDLTVTRLLAVNGLIRIGAAGSGQLFAFLLADRMSHQSGFGSLLVGVIGAAFFFTELVGAPFAGGLADRVGQRRILRWGPVFGIASAMVAALAALGAGAIPLLVVILFLARLNEGASAAFAVPTTLTLLSRATDGDARRRTRVMGAFEVTSLVGMIAGYVVVGVAWDQIGTAAFLVLPPVYGLAWWLVGSGGEETPRAVGIDSERGSVMDVLRRLASKPGNLAFGVSWLAINAVVGLWMQQAPFLLSLPERSATQALVGGFSGQQIGLVFAVWGAAFLVGIALWSWLAPGMDRCRAMSVALVGMLGVVASLAWVNHGGPTVVLWLAALLVCVEAGFTPAAFAHLAELTVPVDASRGAALGLYSVLLGAGQLAGNLLGGPFAARWQMDGVLTLTAILAVVSFVGARLMGSDARYAER